jgi:crotonobetainyl-CoA hydratase
MTETVTNPAALTERRGNVALIIINRPDARNAVNGAVGFTDAQKRQLGRKAR